MEAETETVGKSTCGRGATGSKKKATPPAKANPKVKRLVAMGRLIKRAEIFILHLP
jgi:hypothetical protein